MEFDMNAPFDAPIRAENARQEREHQQSLKNIAESCEIIVSRLKAAGIEPQLRNNAPRTHCTNEQKCSETRNTTTPRALS